MIVLLGAEKGGTGKTTLAVNLAVIQARTDREVLLLDADPQRSTTYWAATRDSRGVEPAITCLQKTGDLRSAVRSLAAKFPDLVIDTGGRDSEELRSALLVADLLLVPVKPSQFDLWSLTKMVLLVEEARRFNQALRALAVINMVNPNPSITESGEAAAYLGELPALTRSATMLKDRIAYRRAVREGLAVVEVKPTDSKAEVEMHGVYQEVFYGRAE